MPFDRSKPRSWTPPAGGSVRAWTKALPLVVSLLGIAPAGDVAAAPGTSFSVLLAPIATFRQGVSGYTGALDTELHGGTTSPLNTNTLISVDLENGGSESQALVRFDSVFGNGVGQVPFGSTIADAYLTVHVTGTASSGDRISLHRMLVSWGAGATWDSLGSGVQANGTDAVAVADTALVNPATTGDQDFDGLAATLQLWSDGTANHGWAILTNSTNGWDFVAADSSNSTVRPLLTVDYTPPPLQLVKRAYRLDGTQVPHNDTAPKGSLIRFLLYVNNPRPQVNDVSLEDILDPGFEYIAESMKFDASVAACADSGCTAGEEDSIYAAAAAGTAGTDAVDGDVVSISGTTISVGDQSVANAQLDVPMAKVWALVFTVRVR